MGGVNSLIIALAYSFAIAVHAQLPAPPATTEDALRQISDQSGVIFTGQVTAIRRVESANGSTGTIEIDFAVDDAILGVVPDTTYTLREWAGLAPNRDSTFTIGRRYLMFLHAPGPSGLNSPVGGPDGAIPILPTAPAASPNQPDSAGIAAQAALTQTTQAASTAAPQSPAHTNFRLASGPESQAATPAALANSAIDLRWIATRVLAPLAYASAATATETHTILTRTNISRSSTNLLAPNPAETAVNADNFPAFNASSLTFEPPTAPTITAPPSTTETYANVLAMLRSWQKDGRAAR